MPFLTEILISVAGGVLTAVILGVFRGRKNQATAVPPIPKTESKQPQTKGPSAIGQFFHMALSVIGGFALSFTGGRFLFKAGILEKSQSTKFILLIVATALVWWILLLFRGKR